MQIDINITPRLNKQKPRKIHLYKKADWFRIKVLMNQYHQDRLTSDAYNTDSVEDLMNHLTNVLQNACSQFVPTKTAKTKDKFPWINSTLTRLYREIHVDCTKNRSKQRIPRAGKGFS